MVVERRGRIVRIIWAGCLVLATLNHASILVRHGIRWDYGGVASASAVYWSSLTIVDPIVAVLLFARPRLGIYATAALIVTNVAHNLAVTAWFAPPGEFVARVLETPQLIGQIGFAAFVSATAPAAWRGCRFGGDDVPRVPIA